MTGPHEPTLIVDTHTHLDDPVFDADRTAVIEAARNVGVRRFINIGYNPERWESSKVLRKAHANIDLALGLHPQEAARFNENLERSLLRTITEARPVAIGEIGFDFARSTPTFEDQLVGFRAQLAIAEETQLPVVIHQRSAGVALMAELDRWPSLAPMVLHSFDGDERLRDWAIERQCFIGIGGLACKPAASQLRDLLSGFTPDRLLLETDAPYLPPPSAKHRRNTPANLPCIAQLLAPIWNLGNDELCMIAAQNASTAFGLDLAIGPRF